MYSSEEMNHGSPKSQPEGWEIKVSREDASHASKLGESQGGEGCKKSNHSKKPESEISITDIKEAFFYDPETGEITNKYSRSMVKANSVSGFIDPRGYVRISFHNREIYGHRLAWAIYYGEWPTHSLDHVDLNKSNNRIANLRKATMSENLRNIATPIHNTSGFKGVYWHKRASKWAARIKHNQKDIHLGLFKEIHDAVACVTEARNKIHGVFARHQ